MTQGKATNYTWLGNSSSWADSNSWSPAGIPDSADNITISSGTYNLVLDQNRKVTNLTLSNKTIDLNGFSLTVYGVATMTSGAVTGGDFIARGSLAAFNGTLMDCTVDADCGYIRLSGSTFNEVADFTDQGLATGNGAGGCTFNDDVTITHNGTLTYFNLGGTSGDTFNENVTFTNNSNRELNIAINSSTNFNGNVILNSTSTGGIMIGSSSGSATLASGKTISIGGSGFAADYLTLRNFTQSGSTAQTLTLTSTAIVNMISCTFNGNLTVSSPGILLKNSTFNGTSSFTRTATSGNHQSDGGNTFNNITLDNAGSSGRVRFATITPDIYTGNATFNSSGGQDVQIAYSGDNLFSGDITINSNKVVFNNASGKVTFTGGNSQTLNGSHNYSFKKLTIDKSANHVTANTTLSVDDTLFLINGNLVTTSSNLLTMKSGSTVSGASNNSFVSGPVKKIGATSFVFPVGKSNYYRNASITAPANSTDAFTCEYFDTSQTVGMNRDTSIKFLSDCNYWTILRTTGTSNVNVKLGYDTTYCSMLDSAHLVVANWNDTLWKNIGNGGITGNKFQGMVANSSSVVKYGKFTLGYSTCQLTAFSGTDTPICHRDSVVLGGTPTALHGSSPFIYAWKYSVFLSDTTIANPYVKPDSTCHFSLLVTDSIGCTSRDTTIITVQPIMEVILSKIKPLCHGDDNGQMSALVTGGIAPYTFLWLPDSSSNDSIFNLSAGDYSLVVTDSNACTQIRTSRLDQPRKIQTWKSVKPISCYGKENGSISIHTLGGISPLQYEWIGLTDTVPFIDSLLADTYYLVITDSNNCTHSDTILVTEPSPASIEFVLYPGDTIFEGLPFMATAHLDYNYNSTYQFFNNDSLIQVGSSNKLFNQDFSNGDTLKVIVLDSSGCQYNSIRPLTVVPKDTVLLYSNFKSYCPGRENPFLISIADPNPGITYHWYKNDIKIDSITGPEYNETIPPNFNCTYTVRASDNSAYGIFEVIVSKIFIANNLLAPSCFGEEEGEIGVSARGGSGIYEYKLNSGDFISTSFWEELPTGTHTVEVRDDTGCISTQTVIIPEVNVETTLEE